MIQKQIEVLSLDLRILVCLCSGPFRNLPKESKYSVKVWFFVLHIHIYLGSVLK